MAKFDNPLSPARRALTKKLAEQFGTKALVGTPVSCRDCVVGGAGDVWTVATFFQGTFVDNLCPGHHMWLRGNIR